MIKEIKYQGYTATPSDYECPDGDLAAATSLIYEDGALHPMPAPSTVFTLPNGYDVIAIHRPESRTHYIIQNEQAIYWLNSTDATEDIDPSSTLLPIITLDTGEFLTDIKGIGNALVILTSTKTHFFIFENNAYTYLGEHLPYIPITFGLQTAPVSKQKSFNVGTIDSVMVNYTYLNAVKNNDQNSFTLPSDAFIDLFTEQVFALHNPLIQECTENNKFGLPFFVRYALRLYDGTLVMQSAPVLMIPYTIPQCNVVEYTYAAGQSAAPVETINVKVQTLAAQLDYAVTTQSAITNCSKWKDIITAVEVFVSAPLYLYKPSGKIKYFINASNWQDHFHVPRLTISKRSGASAYDADNNPPDTNQALLIALPTKDEKEIKGTITQESRFYHIASIPIGNLSTTRTIVDIASGLLSSLEARETMTDGYHEFDSHIFKGAFNYNARMVYFNAKRISGITSMIQASTLLPYTDARSNEYIANLKVHTATKEGKLRCNTSKHTAYISYNGIPVPFLFIPETKIAEVNLLFTATNNVFSGYNKTFSTTTHDHLNGVYLYLGFDNIVTELIDTMPTFYENTNHVFDEPNKLFLSEVNNPFVVRASNITTIDVNSIIAVSAATKALSQGQYGEFPLYAFTDEGVWPLSIGPTGTFSAKQSPTRDVCLDPASITQIDTAVLFATKRGIMMLQGSDSVCISDILMAADTFNPFTTNPPSLPGITTAAARYSHIAATASFKDFLHGCRMIYDYTNQRIIAYNPTVSNNTRQYPYAYIYSLKSKTWTMMPSDIKSSINAYPDCLCEKGTEAPGTNDIINYSEPDTSVTSISAMIVTRPLKLDAPDVLKTIDTIIQRGYFREGHVKTILYGSRDLFRWHLIYSSQDHYLRGFRGTPYKYFRIVLLCNLNKDESISGCTVQYTPRLLDQPR